MDEGVKRALCCAVGLFLNLCARRENMAGFRALFPRWSWSMTTGSLTISELPSSGALNPHRAHRARRAYHGRVAGVTTLASAVGGRPGHRETTALMEPTRRSRLNQQRIRLSPSTFHT